MKTTLNRTAITIALVAIGCLTVGAASAALLTAPRVSTSTERPSSISKSHGKPARPIANMSVVSSTGYTTTAQQGSFSWKQSAPGIYSFDYVSNSQKCLPHRMVVTMTSAGSDPRTSDGTADAKLSYWVYDQGLWYGESMASAFSTDCPTVASIK
jgi:hypothetical protein